MKFLLIVLIGHVVGEIIRRVTKPEITIDIDDNDNTIFHPAEFQLRYGQLRD